MRLGLGIRIALLPRCVAGHSYWSVCCPTALPALTRSAAIAPLSSIDPLSALLAGRSPEFFLRQARFGHSLSVLAHESVRGNVDGQADTLITSQHTGGGAGGIQLFLVGGCVAGQPIEQVGSLLYNLLQPSLSKQIIKSPSPSIHPAIQRSFPIHSSSDPAILPHPFIQRSFFHPSTTIQPASRDY